MLTDDVPFPLRLPREIDEAMRRLAVEHDRSLNKEIVAACREWINRQTAIDGERS